MTVNSVPYAGEILSRWEYSDKHEVPTATRRLKSKATTGKSSLIEDKRASRRANWYASADQASKPGEYGG
jgi:hypothetical protein